MNQSGSVFERIERKYLLCSEQRRALETVLTKNLLADERGLQTIANIYYDTPDYALIRHSLDKPVYKEKLRIRSYGRTSETDMVYVELKKKLKGIVYKRRTQMPLNAAERFLQTSGMSGDMNQIEREIDQFCTIQSLQPAAFVAYERVAWMDPAGSGLRVTMDDNIRCRCSNLRLNQPFEGVQLLREGQILMEVKIPGAMPYWLAATLSDLKIYPVSFSKYGTYYKNYLFPQQSGQGGESHVA